jgi:predicted nucleotidyltransferase
VSLAVFGSAAGNGFSAESDVDFLVEFQGSLSAPEYASAYFSLSAALERLLNRKVDLVTIRSLTNPYFRESVLMERRELYAA